MLRKTSNSFHVRNNQKQYQSWNNFNKRNQVKNKTPTNQVNYSNSSQIQNLTNSFEQNFKIYLRVKPIIIQQQPTSDLLSPKTAMNNLARKIPEQCIKIHSRNSVEIIPPYYTSQQDRVFQYEQIFNGQVCNAEVFQKTMISPIQNALEGFNSTIFIYGMTGAGKTYSMFGNQLNAPKNTQISFQTQKMPNTIGQEQGLVQMTLEMLFRQIKAKKQVKTQVGISFFEIYNENIKDLLGSNGPNGSNLSIVQDPNRGVVIIDLKEASVSQQSEAKSVIKQGLQRRAMNATKSNQVSSRSHAILQFSIKRYIPAQNDKFTMLQSKLFMIDLAGNQKTGNHEAKRFVEGVNINKSLLTLGKCMSILAQQKKNSFVPFRDSKLTRILKESLGGNSKTVMIACISSQKKFYEETLNTLKYSTIAKRIKNKCVKNSAKTIAKEEIPFIMSQQKKNKNLLISQQGFQSTRTYQQDMHQMVSMRFCVSQLLSKIMRLSQQKANMQRTLQQLHSAKNQLQTHIKNASFNNDKPLKSQAVQINQLITEMNVQYSLNLKKMESVYNQIVSLFPQKSCIRQSFNLNPSNSEECGVKKSGNSTYKNINKSLKRSFEAVSRNSNMYNSLCNRENDYLKKSQLFSNQNKDKYKKKVLTIECIQTDQTFKGSPLTELKQQNCTLQRKCQQRVPYRQISINLECSSKNKNKEQFIKKLKETQKVVKGASKQEITQILQEHQVNQYELSNIQMSMLRKLRFFQKQRSERDQNSSKKSLSLGSRSVTPGNKSITFKKTAFRK